MEVVQCVALKTHIGFSMFSQCEDTTPLMIRMVHAYLALFQAAKKGPVRPVAPAAAGSKGRPGKGIKARQAPKTLSPSGPRDQAAILIQAHCRGYLARQSFRCLGRCLLRERPTDHANTHTTGQDGVHMQAKEGSQT